jgi:micrococcal nuclease
MIGRSNHLLFPAGLIAGVLLMQLHPRAPGMPSAASPAAAAQIASATTSPLPLAPVAAPGLYRAHVLRVIDGDTIEARVEVWLGQDIITRVRLRGIDAPEMKAGCASELRQAEAARDRLSALIAGRPVVLAEVGPDKYYGRVVARIRLPEGTEAGAILKAEGLARAYDKGRRASWCDQAAHHG